MKKSRLLGSAAPAPGFDISTFNPSNVRGQLTPKAKETMRLNQIRQAMKQKLYQVFVTDENNDAKPVSPKIAKRHALHWLERIEIAIKTGQLTGWRLPRLELMVNPNKGLGICRGTDSILQGV